MDDVIDAAGGRIRRLNDRPVLGDDTCVLYVMGRDQRINDNHALAAAQALALRRGLPLAVLFCLQPATGVRAREQYTFMLDGLREVEAGLAQLGIPFMLLLGKAAERMGGILYHLRPAAVFFDFSPLRGPLALHRAVAAKAGCAVYEVDTHNIVPAWMASPKQEFGARTLRPKLHRLLADSLADTPPALQPHPHRWPGTIRAMDELQPMIDELLSGVPSNGTDVSRFVPGGRAAARALDDFVAHRLARFGDSRNDPAEDGESHLSPYIHFGQLSAAQAVRAVEAAAAGDLAMRPSADAFLEQLLVRKELSDNFCLYNPDYDRLAGAPQWAQTTLQKHADDERTHIYSRQQLAAALTHDEAWNASQRQLTRSGKMHSYMRMYWAKKVLEWNPSPQEAIESLVYLNDHYSIDGGDPNGYAGILWSVAGLHDRPWGERPVYGTVRSMVYTGLKRKFDIAAYEARWAT